MTPATTWGTCPACSDLVPVDHDGLIAVHPVAGAADDYCDGSLMWAAT